MVAGSPVLQAAWDVEWQRWDVESHLANDGTVLVTESMAVRLGGEVSHIERTLVTSTDQKILIKRFSRVAESGDVEITEKTDEEKDHYFWRDGRLLWNVKPENGSEWEGRVVHFRLEYELKNAIAPVWDIPAGPSSFTAREKFPQFGPRFEQVLRGWRYALGDWDRHYRYDHDVLLSVAFPATGPAELNYTFKYDDAWLNRTPEVPLGRATPNVDYRVTEFRDYLRPGWPPAIELWRPTVRVGSIAVFCLLSLLLWLIFVGGEIRRRGIIGPRIDREWFAREILPQVPEKLALWASGQRDASLFRLFLQRMREKGILALQTNLSVSEDGDPVYGLKLLREERHLRPFERTFLKRLFSGDRREIDSREFKRLHWQDGFDPESELEAAIDEHESPQTPEPRVRPSWFWKLMRFLTPWLLAGGFAAILVETFLQGNAAIFEGPAAAGIALLLVAAFTSRFFASLNAITAAVVVLIPILLTIPGVISLHLATTLPFGPFGSAGLAVFALGCVITVLQLARFGGGMEPNSPFHLGRNYVRKELQKTSPVLDDAWMPHIVALGCLEAVNQWKQRTSVLVPGTMPALNPDRLPTANFPRFSGNLATYPEADWTNLFYVSSKDEREDWGEDEEAEEDKGGGTGKV